jgi:NAD(P)-dependent dehydrogenase (short-subunit alcohol dehydrogenase family)
VARVLITGSRAGLGFMVAELLVGAGHRVTIHARNRDLALEAHMRLPGAEAAVAGDLAKSSDVRELASQINKLGQYDAIIHNAAIGYREETRTETSEGLSAVFATNVLAPYLLTALIAPPARLIYTSSATHLRGHAGLVDPQWASRPWDGLQAYSDSKLYDLLLAFGVARRWPRVRCNAVTPGWVPTKMGGENAPDDLRLGPLTQAWLATSDDPAARVTGRYFYHQQEEQFHPDAGSRRAQDRLFEYCAEMSGVTFPRD